MRRSPDGALVASVGAGDTVGAGGVAGSAVTASPGVTDASGWVEMPAGLQPLMSSSTMASAMAIGRRAMVPFILLPFPSPDMECDRLPGQLGGDVIVYNALQDLQRHGAIAQHKGVELFEIELLSKLVHGPLAQF